MAAKHGVWNPGQGTEWVRQPDWALDELPPQRTRGRDGTWHELAVTVPAGNGRPKFKPYTRPAGQIEPLPEPKRRNYRRLPPPRQARPPSALEHEAELPVSMPEEHHHWWNAMEDT